MPGLLLACIDLGVEMRLRAAEYHRQAFFWHRDDLDGKELTTAYRDLAIAKSNINDFKREKIAQDQRIADMEERVKSAKADLDAAKMKGIIAKRLYSMDVGFEALTAIRAAIAMPFFWAFAAAREGVSLVRATRPRAAVAAARQREHAQAALTLFAEARLEPCARRRVQRGPRIAGEQCPAPGRRRRGCECQ